MQNLEALSKTNLFIECSFHSFHRCKTCLFEQLSNCSRVCKVDPLALLEVNGPTLHTREQFDISYIYLAITFCVM